MKSDNILSAISLISSGVIHSGEIGGGCEFDPQGKLSVLRTNTKTLLLYCTDFPSDDPLRAVLEANDDEFIHPILRGCYDNICLEFNQPDQPGTLTKLAKLAILTKANEKLNQLHASTN